MADMTQPAPAETPKLQALRNLANQLPVANKQVAQGFQSARDMQMQSAVRGTAPGAGITPVAQATGAAAAGQAGQQAIQLAQNQVQQQGQIGQQGLQEQGRQGQAEVGSLQAGAREQSMDNLQRLNKVDAQAKKQLYDNQMSFQKDENNRTLFNETQLVDYARLKAGNDQEFQNYSQKATQVSQRKLQMMQAAYNKVREDMMNKYETAKAKGDHENAIAIQKGMQDMQDRMQREQARQQNSQAAWTAGGTLAGAAVGTVGGPAGVVVGAGVGGALGGAAGSMFG